MNTYLIPTTAPYLYDLYDHIYMIHAESPEAAYNYARLIVKPEGNWLVQ